MASAPTRLHPLATIGNPLAPPVATVLVLPDLRPLAARIRAVLAHLSHPEADDLHRQAERCGRAVVFRGDPAEAGRLDRELRAVGLTTSVNRLG